MCVSELSVIGSFKDIFVWSKANHDYAQTRQWGLRNFLDRTITTDTDTGHARFFLFQTTGTCFALVLLLFYCKIYEVQGRALCAQTQNLLISSFRNFKMLGYRIERFRQC